MKRHFLSAALLCVSMSLLQAAEPSDAMKFARKAWVGNTCEVELGKAAQSQAASQEVKDFGAMMVSDHGKANDELEAIAKKQDIKLPSALPEKKKADIDKLSKLQGKEFDKAYVKDMVQDHKKDLAEFRKAAANLADPELKQYAEKTAGVIAGHLQKIEAIQAGMKE
jgi:putative membrane protein